MSDIAAWIVATTEVAAFTSGPDCTVVNWNDAAVRLFEVRAGDVLGRPCHDVVAGRDPYGNRYCGCQCPLRPMALRGEAIHRFRLDLGEADAVPLPLWVWIIVIGARSARGPSLVHLLEPVLPIHCQDPASKAAPNDMCVRDDPRRVLSPEEASVLDLLGTRVSIEAVAASLRVDPLKARSILLRCLRKLEAMACPREGRLASRLAPSDRRQLA